MIRAFGLTIKEWTCWSDLAGHKQYVALIAADGKRLDMSLDSFFYALGRGMISGVEVAV